MCYYCLLITKVSPCSTIEGNFLVDNNVSAEHDIFLAERKDLSDLRLSSKFDFFRLLYDIKYTIIQMHHKVFYFLELV